MTATRSIKARTTNIQTSTSRSQGATGFQSLKITLYQDQIPIWGGNKVKPVRSKPQITVSLPLVRVLESDPPTPPGQPSSSRAGSPQLPFLFLARVASTGKGPTQRSSLSSSFSSLAATAIANSRSPSSVFSRSSGSRRRRLLS